MNSRAELKHLFDDFHQRLDALIHAYGHRRIWYEESRGITPVDAINKSSTRVRAFCAVTPFFTTWDTVL